MGAVRSKEAPSGKGARKKADRLKKGKRTNQIAALPLRWEQNKLRVLLITSRRTKRWIVPKGWKMRGIKPWRAAEIEALEEAGITGTIAKKPIGHYSYKKVLSNGGLMRCRVAVYPMLVTAKKQHWKEARQRRRQWFSLKKAAKLVDESDLSLIMRHVASHGEAYAGGAPQAKA